MTEVRFLRADGSLDRAVEAPPGTNLLDLAQLHDQPLEGACEGQMACSTCHVIVAADDFALLPRASEEEDDLLDLAPGVTRTSRLACQVAVPEGGLTVRLPATTHDWRRN